MKTKSFKRVRRIVPALVLVLAMIFSVVPAIPASAAGIRISIHDGFRYTSVRLCQ